MNKLHLIALVAGMSVCGMYAQQPPSRVYEPTQRHTREYLAEVRRQEEAASSTGGAAGAAAAALSSCNKHKEAKLPLHVRLRVGLAQARTSPDVQEAQKQYKMALQNYATALYQSIKPDIQKDEQGPLGLALWHVLAEQHPVASVMMGKVDDQDKKAGEDLRDVVGEMNPDQIMVFGAELKKVDYSSVLQFLALVMYMDDVGCLDTPL